MSIKQVPAGKARTAFIRELKVLPYREQDISAFKGLDPYNGPDLGLYKIGGSCSRDPKAFFEQLIALAQREKGEGRKAVFVLSAFHGVTNLVQALIDACMNRDVSTRDCRQACKKKLNEIKEFHYSELKNAGNGRDVRTYFDEEFNALTKIVGDLQSLRNYTSVSNSGQSDKFKYFVSLLTDQILGRPEHWITKLADSVMRQAGISSRAITADNGFTLDTQYGNANIVSPSGTAMQNLFPVANGVPDITIFAGFVGKTTDSYYGTLGRGGSDLTAVALGAIYGVPIILLKDEGAFFTADPKIVGPQAKLISEINIDEAIVAAKTGNQLVHLKALLIAKQLGLEIGLGNFNDFNVETRILPELSGKRDIVFISLAKNMVTCTYDMAEIVPAARFVETLLNRRVFNIMFPGYDSGALIIPADQLDSAMQTIPSLTSGKEKVSTVSIYAPFLNEPGVLGAIGDTTYDNGINILEIRQSTPPKVKGADKPQIISIAVANNLGEETVRLLHDKFVGQEWRPKETLNEGINN